MFTEEIFSKEIGLAGFVNYKLLISFTLVIIYSYTRRKIVFFLTYKNFKNATTKIS